MSTSFWKNSFQDKVPRSGNFVILGGGFVGLSAAYWLSRKEPQARIIVLEKDEVGAGASGRNAGFLTKGSQAFYCGLSKKFGKRQAEEIYHYFNDSLELLHSEILFRDPSIFSKVSSVTLSPKLDLGFGNFIWDEASHSWSSDGEFKVQPIKLLGLMKEILLKKGVEFYEGVEAIELQGHSLHTTHGAVSFDKLLIALNGLAGRFHPDLKTLIFPKRAQMLAVKVKTSLGPHLYYHPTERVYWRMVDHETLVIGGKRLTDEAEENADYEKVNAKVQSALENYVSQNLAMDYEVLRRWSGIMGFTEDELPLVRVMSHPDTFVAAGFSGHGMGLGFRAARDISELMTGPQTTTLFDKVRI